MGDRRRPATETDVGALVEDSQGRNIGGGDDLGPNVLQRHRTAALGLAAELRPPQQHIHDTPEECRHEEN